MANRSQQTESYKRGRFELFATKPSKLGEVGEPMVIMSNHYNISFDSDKTIHAYYVCIIQENRPQTNNNSNKNLERLFRSIIERLVGNNSSPGDIFHQIDYVYDGSSSLFTNESLPLIDDRLIKFHVTLDNDRSSEFFKTSAQDFEIYIKKVNTLSYQSIQDYYDNPVVNDEHFEVIRSINLVIRQLFMNSRFLVGRSNFHLSVDKDIRSSISAMKEVSYGIFCSVQACASGLQLILDRSCTPFMKTLSIDECIRCFLNEPSSNGRWDENNRRRLENILKDYYFEVNHLHRRRYKIFGLTLEPASKVMFSCKNHKDNNDNQQTMISVAEYFHKTYGALRWPELPCVCVRRFRNEFMYFPVELCQIVPDQKIKKLTIKEKADLIRNAARVNPSQRFDLIKESVCELNQSYRTNSSQCDYLRSFGLKISSQPVSVKSRVLPSPNLVEGNGDHLQYSNGIWRINKFYKCAKLNQWILVIMAKFDDQTIDRFIETLIRYGEQFGMQIPLPFRIHYQFDISDIGNLFQKVQETYSNVDLMLFIGCNSEWQYNAVKKCGDILYDVPTQCLRQQNVSRFNQSIAVNILQKINMKLGGINVSIKHKMDEWYYMKPTMVIGVDVAHPSPTEKDVPSIAAIAANYDQSFARYTTSVKIQKFIRQEIIQQVHQMVLEVLKSYEHNTKTLPERIVLYRDGVSESQFQTVYNEEIHPITEALNHFRPGYKPKLTFVIVQKRHHTRFAPDNNKDGVGKNRNIPPGTVIDNGVVHQRHFDFYLCSHAGIQGTSRPSHYCVLYDDNELSADQMEEFTNVLCHLYGRCSRSISIPTPVFYAHLSAFRARAHIQASTMMKIRTSTILSTNNNENDDNIQTAATIRIHYNKHRASGVDNFDAHIEMSPKMKDSMYFC